jgi:hypothetical protein
MGKLLTAAGLTTALFLLFTGTSLAASGSPEAGDDGSLRTLEQPRLAWVTDERGEDRRRRDEGR